MNYSILTFLCGAILFAQNQGNAYYSISNKSIDFTTINKKIDEYGHKDSAKVRELKDKVGSIFKSLEGTKKYILSFRGSEAIYTWNSEQTEATPELFRSKEDSIYFDLEEREILHQKELQGIKVRATMGLDEIPWQFTDETKEILGYTCKRAFYIEQSIPRRAGGPSREKVHNVWYTEELPYGFGPKGLGGLPGLIVVYNDAFFLEKIDFDEPKLFIKKPQKGKLMTEKQFLEKVFGRKL